MFAFDNKRNEYSAEINGIIFRCDKLDENIKEYALLLADAYESKLSDIADFLAGDEEFSCMYGDMCSNKIAPLLKTPRIDIHKWNDGLITGVIAYCEHELDSIHIINVEFGGIFDCSLMSIDG